MREIGREAPIILAGNKCDLKGGIEVEREEALQFSESKGIKFYDVSALNGMNIQSMFNDVAKELTGIQTDIIKQSNIIQNTGETTYAKNAMENQEGRFKLGAPADNSQTNGGGA